MPNYVNIFLGECMENMRTLSLGPFQRDLHCDAASEVKLILILSIIFFSIYSILYGEFLPTTSNSKKYVSNKKEDVGTGI